MPWIAAIGAVAGGLLSSQGSKSAAGTSSAAQIKAAELQKQAADEALAFQRELFGYGQEQDILARGWTERNAAQNLFGYEDAYQAYQDQFQLQRTEMDYGNQIRNNILGQLNDYSVGGRAQIPGLYKMTGQPMGNIPPGLQAPLQPWNVETPNLYPNEQRKSKMPDYNTFRTEFDSYLNNLLGDLDVNRFRETPQDTTETNKGGLINQGEFTGGRSGGGTQRGSKAFETFQNTIRSDIAGPEGPNNPKTISSIRRALVDGTISTEEAIYLLSLFGDY